MTDAVEIYICKPGQKIEEGQMVMSHDIDSKEAAKEDAKKRCRILPSIERVVYYDVSAGGFKVLFSYKNPKVKAPASKTRPMGGSTRLPPKAKGKQPRTLLGKLKKNLGL